MVLKGKPYRCSGLVSVHVGKKSNGSRRGSVVKGTPSRYPKTSVEGKTAEGVRSIKTVRKINPSQHLEC
jgi:hypothetical protein